MTVHLVKKMEVPGLHISQLVEILVFTNCFIVRTATVHMNVNSMLMK